MEVLEQHRPIYELLRTHAATLHFQSIIDIDGLEGTPSMFEVFVRLVDEQGLLVYPETFFPIARQYGLLAGIDSFVFEKALQRLATQRDAGEAQSSLFLNIAEDTLKDNAVFRHILKLLENTQVNKGSLIVDVDKAAFFNQSERVETLHSRLAENGHGILFKANDMNDCKSMQPYSDLISYLKLNRPLIEDIINDSQKRTKLSELIGCAISNGVKVIAGTIEHADMLPILYSVGVRHVQGYFVGMPGEDVSSNDMQRVEVCDGPRWGG